MSGQITKVFEADARRRWSDEEKRAIIEESKTSAVARVAKKHGVATSLLFRWRKAEGIRVRSVSSRSQEEKGFIPIALPPAVEAAPGIGRGHIEIVLGNGRRVLVGSDVDVSALKRVVEALEQR